MIWVYAVCERAGPPLPRIGGLAGAPLEEICEGPLLAVTSSGDALPDEPTLDALSGHERVVEALMADRPVLPMRFGTRFAAVGEVQAALGARRKPLLDALDLVRGRVELAVRVRGPGAEGAAASMPSGSSGQEYVRARLRAGRSAASLHRLLAELAVASRCSPALARGELLHASYLVERPAVMRFRGAIRQLQREHPEAALVCTGPWPAYSFMDEVTK